MTSAVSANDAERNTAILLPMLAVAGIALLLISSAFTVLKETPSFWHNAGGYPVALRELLLNVYYPLLGLDVLLCMGFSGLVAYGYHLSARCSWWMIAAGMLMWMMLLLNIGWLTANNVENMMNGDDLHHHAIYQER